MNSRMYPLMGLQIFESSLMTKKIEVPQTRNLKERFLTIPWKPWVKIKTVVKSVPREEIIKSGEVLICHPEIAERIRRELQRQEENILFRGRLC
jgi:hypothetical protein